ncbi:MAG: NAD(P)/FAD-dependent oxidoreductase [Candidatus Marinimicrobia bacterium]|nr:NAD(P)/FAD-dependent oxidoreductase [Candidatus Neomarinimicrobiota bacterium]
MDKIYDVIIVGSGPAGMFAAERLSGENLSVLVVERGDEPSLRTDMNFGIGGAGTFSDGKLNLTSKIGGDPTSFGRTDEEIEQLIQKVDDVFNSVGAEGGYSGLSDMGSMELKRKAHSAGVEFIYAKQRHIGTDVLHIIIDRFYRKLAAEKNIQFSKNDRVKDIKKKDDLFFIETEQSKYWGKYLIAAPGRAGSYWLREQVKNLGVQTSYGPIDVGIRVEFPYEIYDKIATVMYDAKFRLYTKSFDDLVRTFCTNPRGFITKEVYDEFVLVNGHAKRDHKTVNTNFALLSRVSLTNPVEDSTAYGRDIARMAMTIGGGKPIIQRLSDLLNGRRSTWGRLAKSAITPTLMDVTPGDIGMVFPHRIVRNLIEGITVLDEIISGLLSNNTFLYAPEIKFYDTNYHVTPYMETTCKNFFVAGDASGHSRGIVYAAVTGIVAAEGVLVK